MQIGTAQGVSMISPGRSAVLPMNFAITMGPASDRSCLTDGFNTTYKDKTCRGSAPEHSATLSIELAATVALGWDQPRSNPQSSCDVCLVVKYSDNAASAPVMPVTPSTTQQPSL